MNLSNQNSKIIFGLKVKQLRQKQDLSFADLSKASGLSVSYLNEIEKGKKSPKADKIRQLAEALDTTFEELVSPVLKGNLSPVGELLHSNFLNELPLELFGIEMSKIVEIVANSPLRVKAFISTLVELSRNYALRAENFYFHAVRAYQELHYNYFEEIEQEIDKFVKEFHLPANRAVPVNLLSTILKKNYHYKIEENDFKEYPELSHMRSVFIPKKKKLLLNAQLNEKQKALQLGKELAYNYLELKERIYTSSFLKVQNFQTVLNNYIAGYFAVGLLVNRDAFMKDLQYLFAQKKWNDSFLLKLLLKYEVSPEVLFQRFNVLPRHFDLPKLFFIRVIHHPESNTFQIDKELHLNRQHEPHANGLDEHYCRRWSSIEQLRRLADNESSRGQPVVGVQRSRYVGSDQEYLCITIARPAYLPASHHVSVTIGLLVDDDLAKKVNFLDDPSIPRQMVNVTCQRCNITDCKQRVSPPVALQKRQRRQAMEEALGKLEQE